MRKLSERLMTEHEDFVRDLDAIRRARIGSDPSSKWSLVEDGASLLDGSLELGWADGTAGVMVLGVGELSVENTVTTILDDAADVLDSSQLTDGTDMLD